MVHELASRLAEHHPVTVYTGSYAGSGRSQRRGDVRYVFLPVGWAGPRAGQLLFQAVLPILGLVRRADVWFESLTPPFSASLLPLFARCPVVGLVQMLSGADMARRYKLPFPAIERRGLALYRHFIVLNETDRAAVARCNPRASISLIPNGTNRPEIDESDLGGGVHILFLGRIDVPQKGLDLLLAAMAAARPGMPLTIAGSGTKHEDEKLRRLVECTGVPVRMVGRVGGRRKDELLRTSAMVVVPSRYETFCLSALEGMAYGKPVVCFDLPQLSWIAEDCAVRVKPFDVDGLGAALRDLAGHPERRAEIGRQARALSARHDWSAVADRYRTVAIRLIGVEAAQRNERAGSAVR